MIQQILAPDFMLSNGDGHRRPFHEFLADFNILVVRRVPLASHGPATKLLHRLLAENRGAGDVTVRGFDIRSPDRPCETCREPQIVFTGPDLATICDCDCRILRKLGVVGYDGIFVVRSGPQVTDVGSIEVIGRSGMRFGMDKVSTRHRVARAPRAAPHAGPRRTVSDGRYETLPASK